MIRACAGIRERERERSTYERMTSWQVEVATTRRLLIGKTESRCENTRLNIRVIALPDRERDERGTNYASALPYVINRNGHRLWNADAGRDNRTVSVRENAKRDERPSKRIERSAYWT